MMSAFLKIAGIRILPFRVSARVPHLLKLPRDIPSLVYNRDRAFGRDDGISRGGRLLEEARCRARCNARTSSSEHTTTMHPGDTCCCRWKSAVPTTPDD